MHCRIPQFPADPNRVKALLGFATSCRIRTVPRQICAIPALARSWLFFAFATQIQAFPVQFRSIPALPYQIMSILLRCHASPVSSCPCPISSNRFNANQFQIVSKHSHVTCSRLVSVPKLVLSTPVQVLSLRFSSLSGLTALPLPLGVVHHRGDLDVNVRIVVVPEDSAAVHPGYDVSVVIGEDATFDEDV